MTDVEYWPARELMVLFGYERWENFEKAIKRAMESCETSGIAVSDHFRDVTKMITAGNQETGTPHQITGKENCRAVWEISGSQ